MTRTKITGVCTGALVLTMMATLGVGQAHAQAYYDAAVTTALLSQDSAALQHIADDWRDGRWNLDRRDRWDENEWERDEDEWERDEDEWERDEDEWERDEDEWERDENEWGDEWTLRLPAQKDLVLVAHGGRHWGGHGFSRDCPRYERDYCPRYDGYRDGQGYGRDYYGPRHHYDHWS